MSPETQPRGKKALLPRQSTTILSHRPPTGNVTRMSVQESALTLRPALDADVLPVTLKVLKGNPARHLYERLGFEIVAEDEIEFRMRHAPHASAKTQAK
ncbi:N-acetyltransferase [Paraburkholderia sediminicola]|uniref:hypothetical protein n=1 Tax=Paraburkholderia sediminicola TaxID=458836 RepID=UPI0038BDFA22